VKQKAAVRCSVAADREMLLLCWAVALEIVDHLRRRFPRFNLRAHPLDLRCLPVETRSKLRNSRLLLCGMEL
jgi:hypothetical protein